MASNCDIILISFNAHQYTSLCIESIRKYTDFPYRLIVVDNKSNNETVRFLRCLDKDITVVFNDKNFGFGYANNQALEIAKSEYVCFLNTDTVVTTGWLIRLIKILNDNNASMVGPTTDYVSSECQQVLPKDCDLEIFSKQRFDQHGYSVIETTRLVGFCLVARRDHLKEIGDCFDIRFERGNFEDDDLCMRFVERGYKLLCANGVFIKHFGRQSFKALSGAQTDNTILEKNKKLYIEKWYDTGRIRKFENRSLDIVYVLASDSPSGGVKIVFEHANRLADRGHRVRIYCAINETGTGWFHVRVPIIYGDLNKIPQCDIAVASYFTTIPYVKNSPAKIKIHLCQGYEGLLHKEKAIADLIRANYAMLKTKVVISSWLKEIMLKEYGIDANLVSNGLDQYVFPLKIQEKPLVRLRVLVVGYECLEIKGVNFILNTLKPLSSRFTIVRLSSHVNTTQNLGCEFHCMATMTQHDIAKVYSSCDILISASQQVEGFSLPALEAMASGCAVITTDCGGNRDYIKNGENCLVIPHSQKALVNALELLINNPTVRNKLIANGIETAKKYLWFRKMDELENLYIRLVKEGISEQQISLCMIVKNEENTLKQCLDSVKTLVSEMIIVDTGSIDDTVRIAQEFGANIYHYEWNDDFSAARNYSLSFATKNWVLIMDADEIIAERDINSIKEIIKKEKYAYNIMTRNYVNDSRIEGVNVCDKSYPNEEKEYYGWCPSTKIRLFPNDKRIKFYGKIHELVEKSVESIGLKIDRLSVPVHHYGCVLDRDKSYYTKLSEEKLKDSADVKSMYELASQYMSIGNCDSAIVLWRRLIEIEPENDEFIAKLGTTYNLLKQYSVAEKHFLKSLSIVENEYAYKHLGVCYAGMGDFQKAYDTLVRIAYQSNDLKTVGDFACSCNMVGKFDETIQILEKHFKNNIEIITSWGLLEIAYNEKGVQLAKSGKYEKAKKLFTDALRLNDRFKKAKENLFKVNRVLAMKK